MGRYLFSVYMDGEETAMTPERQERAWRETGEFNDRLEAAGALVFAGGLVHSSEAHVVDNIDGRGLSHEGPVIASGDQRMVGFWIIEAPDDATAHALALEASGACNERVEVRAFR